MKFRGRNLKTHGANLFSSERGAPALPFRTALGALIIKETLGTSDRETVEQIRENPYLQYLIGKKSYNNDPPFDASMLVYFRERIDGNFINRINLSLVKKAWKKEVDEEKKHLRRGASPSLLFGLASCLFA